MGWGTYVQTGFSEELDRLGSKLSVVIGCPVHYPAYGKRLFECMCGVIFPVYILKREEWEKIRKKHEDERKLSKV